MVSQSMTFCRSNTTQIVEALCFVSVACVLCTFNGLIKVSLFNGTAKGKSGRAQKRVAFALRRIRTGATLHQSDLRSFFVPQLSFPFRAGQTVDIHLPSPSRLLPLIRCLNDALVPFTFSIASCPLKSTGIGLRMVPRLRDYSVLASSGRVSRNLGTISSPIPVGREWFVPAFGPALDPSYLPRTP